MRIDAKQIELWRDRAGIWVGENCAAGAGIRDIVTGRDAWTVAHRCEIVREAYDLGRDIVDAHIQTALEKIFPNAVFKDAKRY